MIPKVGDIYYYFNDRLGKYNACQVTEVCIDEADSKRSKTAVLMFDWIGDNPPTPQEFAQMKPFYPDFFFWPGDKAEHSYVDLHVPKGYTLAGNIPPILTEEIRSYAGWPGSYKLWRQTMWRAIPQELREQFKAAMRNDEKVMVGEAQYSLRFNGMINEGTLDRAGCGLDEFRKLPCISKMEWGSYPKEIREFLCSNPFVYEFYYQGKGQEVLDFRGTSLDRISIRSDDVREIYLNDFAGTLILHGKISDELKVHSTSGGKWLTVQGEDRIPLSMGLSQLSGVHIARGTEIAIEPIVKAYGTLREIRLWGKPGVLKGLSSLALLPKLEHFTTVNLFGFIGEDFPKPAQLPCLTWLWMTSLPAEAAAVIKKTYKKEADKGLNFSIAKARKPEWLAENLDNPFRDWDGRENITPTNAKKAATQYKKTRSELLGIIEKAKAGAAKSETHNALEAAAKAYIAEFNKMDKRKFFIETIEREEICVVLSNLLEMAEQELGNAVVDINAIINVTDELRDF